MKEILHKHGCVSYRSNETTTTALFATVTTLLFIELYAEGYVAVVNTEVLVSDKYKFGKIQVTITRDGGNIMKHEPHLAMVN